MGVSRVYEMSRPLHDNASWIRDGPILDHTC